MNLAEACWLKTDGSRGIDRYIDYFGGAVDPFASRADDTRYRLSLNRTTGGHPRPSPAGRPSAASEVRLRS